MWVRAEHFHVGCRSIDRVKRLGLSRGTYPGFTFINNDESEQLLKAHHRKACTPQQGQQHCERNMYNVMLVAALLTHLASTLWAVQIVGSANWDDVGADNTIPLCRWRWQHADDCRAVPGGLPHLPSLILLCCQCCLLGACVPRQALAIRQQGAK